MDGQDVDGQGVGGQDVGGQGVCGQGVGGQGYESREKFRSGSWGKDLGRRIGV